MPNSHMCAEWKTAKKEFEQVTLAKRPKATFAKIFSKGSGIEPALKKMDDLANKAKTKDSPKKLREGLDDLLKKVAEYIKILDVEIQKEGGIKTDMLKALKALKAKTDKFESHYEVSIVEHTYSAQQLFLDNKLGDPAMKKAIDSALADVKRVLAKPDQKTYDAVMGGGDGAGRRLTTAIQGLGSKDWDKQSFKDRLNDYATGNKMTIKANATDQEVVDEIKRFSAIVKDLNTAFSG